MLYEVRADLTPHRSALDNIDPGTPTTGQLMGICCVTQSNPTNAIDLRALSDGDVIMVAALVVNNNNKQLFLSCEKEFFCVTVSNLSDLVIVEAVHTKH